MTSWARRDGRDGSGDFDGSVDVDREEVGGGRWEHNPCGTTEETFVAIELEVGGWIVQRMNTTHVRAVGIS